MVLDAASALILGIVEGFTEFLPISSTAHLNLASDLMGFAQSEYVKTFEIAIQSGAILAVVVLYWKKFLDWEIVKRVAVAFVPTAILGAIFYKLIKSFLIGNTVVALLALALGGLFLIVFEKLHKNPADERVRGLADSTMSYKQSFLVGLFQSVAMIPGVSRAAATIVGGMLLGVRRAAIVEFSFLLAVPTMLAATGYDLIKSAGMFSLSEVNILAVGFIASFVMAVVSIKFLLSYIRRHSFTAFGVYRILLVLVFIPAYFI
ncbi:MAG: undecaprenyl-diphosphatase [Candidatus Liptonbacteria bacterium RIFCSPLOWO2_01_FULL_52_25]|uniref:Undecaprenyl-diphosphatase n=1 Tax=Candidatus Liptonbacteria bacterium RIFCSPLOWO2_01_FULL_52_25 TaxID=1798650 RepID=A0A1G2CG71_9BACT|nr:MAG: undecaprenyl-diphosphatase [Candidatus Liptonbacteria bacterium RIFCSPLOWO2_01_FULL_52_25]